MAVLDQDRSGEQPSPTGEYTCDCPGFKTLLLERMCLRCLDAYAEGLPHVLSGFALEHEMRRVAGVLAATIKNDPLLANLPVAAVLRVAEGRN